MKFSFEVPFEEVQKNPDSYVSSVFSCLESEFMVLPKGPGFIEYPTFERGYEALKQATSGFTNVSVETVFPVTLSQYPSQLWSYAPCSASPFLNGHTLLPRKRTLR